MLKVLGWMWPWRRSCVVLAACLMSAAVGGCGVANVPSAATSGGQPAGDEFSAPSFTGVASAVTETVRKSEGLGGRLSCTVAWTHHLSAADFVSTYWCTVAKSLAYYGGVYARVLQGGGVTISLHSVIHVTANVPFTFAELSGGRWPGLPPDGEIDNTYQVVMGLVNASSIDSMRISLQNGELGEVELGTGTPRMYSFFSVESAVKSIQAVSDGEVVYHYPPYPPVR